MSDCRCVPVGRLEHGLILPDVKFCQRHEVALELLSVVSICLTEWEHEPGKPPSYLPRLQALVEKALR